MMHIAQSVETTRLQQEPPVVFHVSITMLTDHTLPYHSFVPTTCVLFSQRNHEFVSFNHSLGKASLGSSKNSWCCAFVFGPNTSIKHRERSMNLNVSGLWIFLPVGPLVKMACQMRRTNKHAHLSRRVFTYCLGQRRWDASKGISFVLFE